jgi:hypothetical protein
MVADEEGERSATRVNRGHKLHLGIVVQGWAPDISQRPFSLNYDDAPSAGAGIADRGAVRKNAICLIH